MHVNMYLSAEWINTFEWIVKWIGTFVFHLGVCLGCRSVGHTQKRMTENLHVPYYVNERFSQEYSGVSLRQVERSVEEDFISTLRNSCWKEKQHSTIYTKHFHTNLNTDRYFCVCFTQDYAVTHILHRNSIDLAQKYKSSNY